MRAFCQNQMKKKKLIKLFHSIKTKDDQVIDLEFERRKGNFLSIYIFVNGLSFLLRNKDKKILFNLKTFLKHNLYVY